MKNFVIIIFIISQLRINAQLSDGLILFSTFSIDSKNTYLIDNDKNIIQSWIHDHSPASHPYLLPDTSIIYPYKVTTPFLDGGAGGVGGGIKKILKDGTVEWNYIFSDSIYQHHHDIEAMPNGNILIIVWEIKDSNEAARSGRQNIESEINQIWAPAILELNPGTGEIVWEWHIWDHLVQDIDSTLSNFGNVKENSQLMNINYGTIGSINGYNGDWMHINSIDYNPIIDQIVISSRNTNEFYIIDHSTSIEESSGHSGGNYGKGGDFLYRWGNPEVYNMGDENDKKLFGQHDVSWITTSIGSNDILLFNNGLNRPDGDFSTVDIVRPELDLNGKYLSSDENGFLPVTLENVFYQYGFYNGRQSSAQYLDNGNILITGTAMKKIIEIDLNGNVLWEHNLFDHVNRASKYSSSFFNNLSINKDVHKEKPKVMNVSYYPNPFNPIINLEYNLPEDLFVKITVYDMLGNVVNELVNDKQKAGSKYIQWNAVNNRGKPVSAGIYLFKIQARGFYYTKKMILLK